MWIGLVCATDRANPDGGCGCGRSFAGMTSHRATTTAMVRDVASLTGTSYAARWRTSFASSGWPVEAAAAMAADLTDLVRDLPMGAIVERRLDVVTIRRLAAFAKPTVEMRLDP